MRSYDRRRAGQLANRGPLPIRRFADQSNELSKHSDSPMPMSGIVSTVAAVVVWLVVAGYMISATTALPIRSDAKDDVTLIAGHSQSHLLHLDNLPNTPVALNRVVRKVTQYRTLKKERPTTTTTSTTTTTTTTVSSITESDSGGQDDGQQTDDESAPDNSTDELDDNEGGAGAIIQPESSDDVKSDISDNVKSSAKKVSAEGPKVNMPVVKHHHLVRLPFIRPKNESVCVSPAYLEFPPDPVGPKWRSRGLVVLHVAIVVYMFYALALVCERYFIPSLQEFAQRLNLSEDVAGATLMSAGSSAPELFTAILGVFIAKGDVGTGAIVGSAVFNILFVIGICAFVTTTAAHLNWWPILRDSVFYTFTVLILILFIYDERVTSFESLVMLILYGAYIVVMCYNDSVKEYVIVNILPYLGSFGTSMLEAQANEIAQAKSNDDVFCGGFRNLKGGPREIDFGMFRAALIVIGHHKRLFSARLRFQSAIRLVIYDRQQERRAARDSVQLVETSYLEPTGGGQVKGPSSSMSSQRQRMAQYAITQSSTLSKTKKSLMSENDLDTWTRPPADTNGLEYYLWLAKIPVNFVLYHTVPDCTLYPDKYYLTFIISIIWTAVFSYIMVWMVCIIGYTLGIPDSIMGITFLAAGTSVPDAYSSIHVAKLGMADMAVSNSIGSNIFDILVGLSLPWFIQTAIYPGIVATINSRGVIYSVILLFIVLIATIYLMNHYNWILQPRLGFALLVAYVFFIILTSMLEFNLFGHVNPPPCI